VPHVLTLNRSQIHILPDVIIGRANTERLEFLLSLEVLLGDTSLDDEGSYLDLLVDFLLALVFDFLNHLL
jgi:hypothetical protein